LPNINKKPDEPKMLKMILDPKEIEAAKRKPIETENNSRLTKNGSQSRMSNNDQKKK
jgi:hypothetical protein